MHNTRRGSVAELRTPRAAPQHPVHRTSWPRHAATCVLIAVAMLVVIRWWAWAWAPACIIGILYLMYASLEMTESRARALRRASTSGPRPDTRSTLVERERIGARILVTLMCGALSMALVVAALVLDARTLGLGTAMAFGIVVFVGLPTWAAAVGDGMP